MMQQKLSGRQAQLTPAEAAEILRVAPVTLRSWAQKGWLRAEVTAGGHRRYSQVELGRFALERGLTLHWPELQRSRVLVVDDDVHLGSYLYELLVGDATQPEVMLVHDGFEAGVQLVEFRPDVVLLDLMMPGLDGFAVCERIKRDPKTSSIRVIAMTGYPSPENTQRILQLGAELCLNKPFDPQSLLTALNLMEPAIE